MTSRKVAPLTKFVGHRIVWFALFGLLILSSGLVAVAQESNTESDDLSKRPEIIDTEVERLSEEFPEILDIEWVEYTDRDITIWLGDTYEQTPVENLLEMAQQGIDSIAPELASYVQILQNNPDLIRFVAFDLETAPTGFVTNVIIVREKAFFDIPAMDIAEATINILPDTFEVYKEPTEFELEGFEDVATVQWSMDILTTELRSLVYIIVKDGFVYSITVSTSDDRADYDQAKAELMLQTLIIEDLEEDT